MTAELGAPLSSLAVAATQFVGAALRPDGNAFYLTTAAPDAPQTGPAWRGAFYAPFEFGHVTGTVDFEPHGSNAAYVTVAARFIVADVDHVVANWRVIGPAPTVTPINSIAVIDRIVITQPGPHREDDIRRCITLHAPQGVWGEPQALVAMQCGVAVACLTEAVC